MTLNLKSEKGKEILRRLVADSDILIENYRPGVREKLGLGYEDLKKINPGLIYGCVSGFGHYGPYSQRAGNRQEPEPRSRMSWEGCPAV